MSADGRPPAAPAGEAAGCLAPLALEAAGRAGAARRALTGPEILAVLEEHVRSGVLDCVLPPVAALGEEWTVSAGGEVFRLAADDQARAWVHGADSVLRRLEQLLPGSGPPAPPDPPGSTAGKRRT